jgi:hypothetical protein
MMLNQTHSLAHGFISRGFRRYAALGLTTWIAAAGCTTIEPTERVRSGASGPSIPPVGVMSFDTNRDDLGAWKTLDNAFETRSGHVLSHIYMAQDGNAEFPLVHISTWDNAGSLAAALLDESGPWSAIASKTTSAIYGPSSTVGDIRDSLVSSVMIIVPFDTPADSAGALNGYHLVDEYFKPQPGFVGSILLRRIGGSGGFGHVILSRWASREEAVAVTRSEVFRTLGNASGIVSKVAFYLVEEE